MTFDFSKSTILIIGDVMLDKYHIGKVHRISPEAPVPVVKVERSHFTLGGAGNVANNITHLQGNAVLIGLVGKDNDRSILCGLLDKINVRSVLFETEQPTLTKVRVIGEHQQIVRLDFEDVIKLDEYYINQIIVGVNKWLDKVSTIVISDYDKGVCNFDICQYVINAANKKNICVIADPKGRDWERYRGAIIIKPNVKELSYAVGEEIKNEDYEIERYGVEVLKKYNIRHLLVTRSEKGMSLISSDGVSHFPTETKEVFDVSGAGDTVVAVLAVAVASGIDLKTSVQLANKAAGIVVSKMGTAPIEYDELISAYHDDNSKVIDAGRIYRLVNDLRLEKKKIVFTNGCFDILHRGHISYLRAAKKLGDVLIVGLNTDGSIKRLKGDGRPINNQQDRVEMLSALEFVDYVLLFDDDTPAKLIQLIMPDVLVKGGDYMIEGIVGNEFAGEVIVIPFIDEYSTTELINRINHKR